MLGQDVEAAAAAASGPYAGNTNWETLDRVISAKAERDVFGTAHADYYDPWDALDRDASTDYDSTVLSPSGTIGDNGLLTNSTLNTALELNKDAGGKDPDVWLGSHAVYRQIQDIFNPSVRYSGIGEANVVIDVNGVQTHEGTGVGLQIPAVYGIPFISTADSPRNSGDASEVGRLFGLDTSDEDGFGYPRIGIQVARPTTYMETGSGAPGWPFTTGVFGEKAVYWTCLLYTSPSPRD